MALDRPGSQAAHARGEGEAGQNKAILALPGFNKGINISTP